MLSRKSAAAIGLTLLLCATPALAETPPPDSPAAKQEAEKLASLPPVVQKGAHLDPSGRKQTGRVSYYAHHFTNRKMADGNRFNPEFRHRRQQDPAARHHGQGDQSAERQVRDGARSRTADRSSTAAWST